MMFTKKAPLHFVRKGSAKPDKETAADAKKPGDAVEDKVVPKKPAGKGAAFFAKKAATGLALKKPSKS